MILRIVFLSRYTCYSKLPFVNVIADIKSFSNASEVIRLVLCEGHQNVLRGLLRAIEKRKRTIRPGEKRKILSKQVRPRLLVLLFFSISHQSSMDIEKWYCIKNRGRGRGEEIKLKGRNGEFR